MGESVAVFDVLKIGIAEGAVCQSPHHLRTTGLGSCVGITLFDPVTMVAGLVHIMLPCAPADVQVPTKYADTGIDWLTAELVRAGAIRSRICAKIAGGAQMFISAGKGDLMRIGPRNVDAVESTLLRMGIGVVAKDVGGNTGRTIEFDTVTGLLQVRTALCGTYEI